MVILTQAVNNTYSRKELNNMTRGDNVSIRYNEFLTKAATVLETSDEAIKFFDNNGKFILTKAYIERAGIVITELEED